MSATEVKARLRRGGCGRSGKQPRRAERRRPIRLESLEERRLLAIDLVGVPDWVEQGPGPIANGSVVVNAPPSGVTNPVVGAVEQIAVHPSNPDLAFIATVNGGVWRTENLTANPPSWTPLTDQLASLGIGAIAYQPGDVTPMDFTDDVLFAGTGRFSSSRGGLIGTGVLKTTDGGANWTLQGEDVFSGLNIRSIVPTRLSGVVLAATVDGRFHGGEFPHRGGLYGSLDGGDTWLRISGTIGEIGGVDFISNKLPDAPVSHVVSDLSGLVPVTDQFFAAVPGRSVINEKNPAADETFAGRGIYRSIGGLFWEDITGNLPAAQLNNSTRIELAVSPTGSHTLFAAIIDRDRQLSGIFRAVPVVGGAVNWTQLPSVPQPLAGKQGDLHFAITVDPTNDQRVFVGGDTRGPFVFNPGNNSWTRLVESEAGGTVPHADARDLVVSSGVLLEANDGGIYRLTTPGQSSRRWESLNGNLRITEFSRIAYDPVQDIILGGTQDNGSVEFTPTILTTFGWSNLANSRNWNTQFLGPNISAEQFAVGDGNNQAVDASDPNRVVRYNMENHFQFFSRRAFDSNGMQIDLVDASHACRSTFEPPGSGINFLTAPVLLAAASTSCTLRSGLTAFGGLDRKIEGFTDIPFVLNAVPGHEKRMLLGLNGLYESHNQGDIIRNVTPPDRVLTEQCKRDECIHAIAYGGFEGGAPRPSVAYVAAGGDLYFRPDNETAPFRIQGAFAEASHSALIQDIVMDPTNFRTVYVVTGRDVLKGTHIGETDASGNDLSLWSNITAHLKNLIQVDQTKANQTIVFRSAAFVQVPAAGVVPAQDVLLVGGVGGVYRLIDPAVNDVWTKYGAGLPNVEVTDLVFDKSDDLLIAATRGRGVWVVPAARQTLATEGVLVVTGDDAPSNSFVLSRDPDRRRLLEVQAGLATGVETKTVELTTLRNIAIFGQGGQDVLTISTVNGVIELPRGLFDVFDTPIFFDGGSDGDILEYLLASGDTLTPVPTPPLVPKVHLVQGSRGSTQGQLVSFHNVEDAPGALLPELESDIVAALGQGLTIASQSDNFAHAFAVPLPVVGRSLPNVLQGAVAQLNPISDPRGGASAARTGVQSPGTTLLRRLLEEGQGGFPLSDIGSSITTFEELRERLDLLDGVDGNVQFTDFADGVLFDLQVEKPLRGLADLDLRGLTQSIDIGGTAEVTADVTLHLLVGVDSRGFFIDTDRNPDSEFSVGNLRITGAVKGDGRLGLTDVLLTAGTLSLPADVRIFADLLEPDVDPAGHEQDGLIHLHELDSSPLTTAFAEQPSLDDVVFTGTFSPAPVEVGQPAPFALAPGEVTLRWADIANPVIEDAAAVTGAKADGQPDAAGQELVAFLRSSSDELLLGLASLASQFQTIGQVDVLGANLSLTAASLGDVLNSAPQPLDIPNADLANISSAFLDGGFQKVNVLVNSASTLAQQSIAAGDEVRYFDTTGALVTDAVVDAVDADSFTLRFTGALSKAPRASMPSFQIQRGGSLSAQLGALLNVAFEGDTAPTLQELARRFAELSGFAIADVGLSSSGSGDSRVVEITAAMNPAALVFRRPLDLAAGITGFNVPGLQDLVFTMDSRFQVTAGVRLGADLALGERFYLKDNAAPELSLQVTAVVDNPSGSGAVGFLDVRLEEDSAVGNNSGVSMNGTVTVNLVDPQTVANDGRIERSELVTTDSTALSTLVNGDLDLRADIDGLLVRADVTGASAPSDMKLSLDGASDQGHFTSVAELAQLPQRIQFVNKDAFTNYNNITGNLVADTLRALVNRLAELGKAGSFTTKLPLLNVNISEMIDLGAVFDTTIGDPNELQTRTAAAFHAYLQTKFPGLQTAITGNDIRFTVNVPLSASRMLPLGLNLGGALGSLASSGALSLSAAGSIDLVFGINTGANLGLEERAYITSDGSSKVSLTASANAGYDTNNDGVLSPSEGQPLTFTAGLGPLASLSVLEARVLADAQFGVRWTGGAGGKLTLADVAGGGFGVAGTLNGQAFDGSIQAVIPLDGSGDNQVSRDPTQLVPTDAWIDVAGKLKNLTGGFDFNANPNQPAHHTGAPGQAGPGGVDDPLSSSEIDALAPTQILVHSYNIDGLLAGLVSFNPASFTGMLDGLDGFLNTLQALLNNAVLAKDLPVIGTKLKDAVNFVTDLHNFVTTAKNTQNLTLDLLKQKMLDTLGPDGAKLLKDLDGGGVTLSDIPLALTKNGLPVQDPADADRIEFTPVLHTDLIRSTLPIDFDLGFDAIGLSMNPGSAVNLDVALDYKFGFGFSKADGFYYVSAPADDLKFTFKASLAPSTQLEGRLAFLRVLATDNGTMLTGTIAADLKDPINNDGKLTFTEFAQLPNTSLGDLVSATVAAGADVKLHLKADFGSETFPDISTDFRLQWNVAVGADSGPMAGAAPLVEFKNITLGLGSYIKEFIKPIMNTISGVLDPIRPVLDVLRARLPGFSDLPTEVIRLAQLNGFDPEDEVSLLDIGKVLFGSHPIFQAIELVELIDRIVMNFESAPGGEAEIPLGDFTINEDVRAKQDLQALAVGALNDVLDEIRNLPGLLGEFAGDLIDQTIGSAANQLQGKPIFAMPLLEHPESAIKLLLGQHVNLFEVNVPVPPVNQPINIPFRFGPLVVGLEGLLKIDWHLAFGYDTYGISRAIATGDPTKAFLGFFIGDTLNLDGTGPDVPEVAIDAQLFVKGGLDIFVADAIVKGGIFTDNLKIDLYEPPGPSHDGKIRFDELEQNWPDCVFETTGSLKVGFYAEVRIGVDLGFVEIKKTILSHTFDERTLLDLSHSCDPTKAPPPPPILATDIGGGVLQLNMGPNAGARVSGNLTDGDEVFTVIHISGDAGGEEVEVQALGLTQRFSGVKRIYAEGGLGADTIVLQPGVVVPSELWGDFRSRPEFGHDILEAGGGDAIIHGGGGNDQIRSRQGSDMLFGDDGDDVIFAGAGIDRLEGGAGRDRLFGEADNDTLLGHANDDELYGGDGDDQLDGGADADLLFGEAGADTLTGGSGSDQLLGGAGDDFLYGGADNDLLQGEDGKDRLYGENGHDVLRGEAGDDWLYGGAGTDDLDGAAGDDQLYGEAGFDMLRGGAGRDVLDGGDGNDWLFGDADNDKLIGGNHDDFLFGGVGDDVLEGNAGRDRLEAGAGDDQLDGGAGDDLLLGDAGKDTLNGGADNDWLDGGAGDDMLSGGVGEDIADGGVGDDRVFGGPDNDLLRGGIGADVLRGEQGSDRYEIFFQGGVSNWLIDVADSVGGSENDQLFFTGTPLADRLLLRAAPEGSAIGKAFVALLNDGSLVERTNYVGIERLAVSGSLGNDHFAVDDIRAEATLDGGIGNDSFQIGQLYRSQRTPEHANVDPGDAFATIETTRGFLSNGVSRPLTVFGGPGNDDFVVFHNKATLNLFGDDGDDIFAVKAFALVGSQDNVRDQTDISGGAGADLVRYVVNANVNVDGGDGFDTVIVVGTEFSEDFVVTRSGVYGAGLHVNFFNIELLKADGAEGDDRFFVQSTSEKFIAQIAGGLGSDTFNLAGDAPPVVSNDLRGHSGVLAHEVASADAAYAGLKAHGVSANVADNEEPGVVITQSGGSTVLQEGGFSDTYTVVLTRAPVADVRVRVSGPAQSDEEKELRRKMFRVRSAAPGATNTPDVNAVTLLFTPGNWFIPQTVIVEAPNDDFNPTLDYDDGALEGTRTGVINHVVESNDSISGSPSMVAGVTFTDATAPFPTGGETLRGRILEIVEGPGVGQEQLILGNTATELTLSGKFRITPTSASKYVIRRYHNLAVPSVLVQVYDNDAAGVIVEQTENSTSVIEAGTTDEIKIRLTRAPVGAVTIQLDGGGQVSLSPASLTFDSTNWNTLQPIAVTAINDVVREGLHHGLIQFTVQSATDMDRSLPAKDAFNLFLTPKHFVGLSRTPREGSPVTVTVGGIARHASRFQVVANKVVFLDALGRPELVAGSVSVSYRYLVPGYHGLELEPVLVNIGDDDVAGVVVQESFGSTDVIEGGVASDGQPRTDTYTVMLTSRPMHDVTVRVKPQVTVATRGAIRNELVQVRVAALGLTPDADGVLSLVFTPDNWSQPRTVQVIAVDDTVVDGGDMQVFAPIPHTVNGIQGPLFIDGQGGLGSLVAFEPLMLPGETNIRASTGNVVVIEADAITIQKSDALNWLETESSLAGSAGYMAHINDLLKRTITITEGPGLDQFRLIVSVTETGPAGEHLRLELNEAWDVPADQLSGITKYALTEESSTFFVNEEEQVDFLRIFHTDSMADSSGRMTEDRITGLGLGPDLVIGGALQPGGVTFEHLEAVSLQLGRGMEQFEAVGTPSRRDNFRTWTTIQTGPGDDIVTVALNVQDLVVAAGKATGGGENMLADAAASFSTAGRGLEGYQLHITGGVGAGQSRRIRFNTATQVTVAVPWDTLPDATSTYEVINEADGLLAVDGETGDDVIDASASTLPIVIFGGAGPDRLTGGSSDDMIFGDRGRVDYLDEAGAIVTRLGTAPPVITGMVSAAANTADSAMLTDSAAAFPTSDDGLAGLFIRITNGAGDLQLRRIVSNTATELVLDAPWDELPDATSTYRISTIPERQTDGVRRDPTRLFTIDDALGAGDEIYAGAGADQIFGGVGSDTIYAGAEPDVVFGDSGRIDRLPAPDAPPIPVFGDVVSTLFDRIRTIQPQWGAGDNVSGDTGSDWILGGAGGDMISGGDDDDLVLGDFGRISFTQGVFNQLAVTDMALGGPDTIFGNTGDDLLIGGAFGDSIDGNEGNDLVFGDAVLLGWRGADTTNPRFQTLRGSQIYSTGAADASGADQVDGIARNYRNPAGGVPSWTPWQVLNLYHTAALEAAPDDSFGNDYLAGGADHDMVFGQLGEDTIQGDGSILFASAGNYSAAGSKVGAARDASNLLLLNPSFEAATDGDDYIEGNGGADVILGGLGQDDLLGGSSELFTLDAPEKRPDGADLLFGGAGLRAGRNADVSGSDPFFAERHARDADLILGDNGNIYRLVGIAGLDSGGFLTFNYDVMGLAADGYSAARRLIPRAARLLDYTPGGPDFDAAGAAHDLGADDEIHGESGDDAIYGTKGNDVLFGDAQDDDLIGGWGADWISGGAGIDGVLGDDGRIFTARYVPLPGGAKTPDPANPAHYAESLYGVFKVDAVNKEITTPGRIQQAIINPAGALFKSVDLTPFNLTPKDLADDLLFAPVHANDIVYGGSGNDFLHGGAGDDAISGAEALPVFFAAPHNPGNVLRFGERRAGEFYDYDEFQPMVKLDGFLLNFSKDENDGADALFGDLGNDWLAGGVGRDHLYGGFGDDLLDADDDKDTGGGLNNTPDTSPNYEDIAYGGAGRDVLIGNTGGDRLIDWVGEFNSYLVPFAPFGVATVSRTLQPQLPEYLLALSQSDGADRTRAADGDGDLARWGEPYGELGMALQRDPFWRDQTGAPDDPQAGNVPGGSRDVLRSADFNSGAAQGFSPDSGTWSVQSGRYQVAPSTLGGEAVSVFYVDTFLPHYFEVQATLNAGKPIAGYKSNAFLVFDYQSPTNFKFAGIDISTNKLQMGRRTAAGWQVDVQTPAQLKSDRDYNVLLAINGVTVTLLVDNAMVFNHTFAPRIDADGFAYGLSAGMVGLGANNSIARIDNVEVQVVPPVTAAEAGENFDDGVDDLFTPASGQWTVVGGRYFAEPAAGVFEAIALTPFEVEPLAYVEWKATIGAQQFGGLVFDAYGPTDFKFAALLPEADQVVIGHRTSRGWFIDAVASRALDPQATYNVQVVLKGLTANVFVNGQLAVGHVFNALVTDGDLGLVARNGVAVFDNVLIRSDDAQMQAGPGALLAEGEAATALAALEASDPGVKYWSNPLNRFDVDGTGHVGLGDLLVVVGHLRSEVAGSLNAAPPRLGLPNHVDVNRDRSASLADLLDLVQELRRPEEDRDQIFAHWLDEDHVLKTPGDLLSFIPAATTRGGRS